MNVCLLSGRLVRNAVLRGGERKVMLFTLSTPCGRGAGIKEHTAQVPCVVFDPPPEMEAALVTHGEGTHIELEGRVVTSSYEQNGERKFTTEVIAFTRSITVGPG
jgi:single-stranded DNA-binding protein